MTRATEILLLRHGHSTANARSIVAGRDKSVGLSKRGLEQSLKVADFLEASDISRIVVSPLLRARETIAPFIKSHPEIEVIKDSGIIEMEYGQWSGQSLARLSKKPLWRQIQNSPSSVRFPDGESFLEMLGRSTEAIQRLAKPGKRTLFVSHGDVIKAITAHYLGLHLDQFQKIAIDPASISRIVIHGDRVTIAETNATAHLKEESVAPAIATLGGGSGAQVKKKR